MLGGLFTELKRRNVIRVAAVYLIASWLLIQVADVMFPLLQLPDWSTRLMAGILMLGFPLAVILAWVFEITPEGVKKETEIDRGQSTTQNTGRRIDFVIIGLLAVGLVYVGYVRQPMSPINSETDGASAAITDKSIAVLPFENMSGDAENEYFSDGLSEELLNLLAKIDELKVAARTSSFSFKGKDYKIPEVARELGVATVLEGSVRKSGNRVRVTAQLIDAASGFHLWSDTFDRELNDIFAIQDEIATKVVAALEVELLDREAPSAHKTMVANIEAYDYHLKGWHELNQTSTGFVDRAMQYFEKAIELDPDYAPAYAGLARTYLFADNFRNLTRYESMTKAAPLLERALELDPDLADAYIVRAVISQRTGSANKALTDLDKALRLNPGEARAYSQRATVLGSMGDEQGAIEAQRHVTDMDPLDINARAQLAGYIGAAGDFEAAEQIFLDLREEYANYGLYYDAAASFYENYYRNATAADHYATLYGLRRDDPWGPAHTARLLYQVGEIELGDLWIDRARAIAANSRYIGVAESALNYATLNYAQEEKMARDGVDLEPNIPFAYSRLAYVQMHQGKNNVARENFEKAYEMTGYEDSGQIPWTLVGSLGGLLYLYRTDGDTEAFDSFVQRAEPTVKEVLAGGTSSDSYLGAAFYYGAKGDRISAIYNLQKAVDTGLSQPLFLEIGVEFRDIRDMPEFQALLKTVKDRQAEERQAMLANNVINISGS